MSRRLSALFIVNDSSRFVGATNDHINSISQYTKNLITTVDIKAFEKLPIDLSRFDCLILHHSVPIGYRNTISSITTQKFEKFSGLKALFIQDEMRWVESTTKKIEQLGISLIFSVVNPDVLRKIYQSPYFEKVRFETVLTGYVPENLLGISLPKYEDRRLDVVYRARRLPAWYGKFGREKSRIAEIFEQDASKYDLEVDISCEERDRIYGDKWIRFLSNSKATLGAESGSSFVDYTGDIAPAVEAFENQHPDASFETIENKFLEGRDGDVVIHVISPRCFEAAALKTLMIMYPGDYSGALEPWRHYVVLNRDHSNMEEVVKILKDPVRVNEIVEAAYKEVACNERWTYRHFVRQVDDALADQWTSLKIGKATPLNASERQNLEERSRRISRKHRVKLEIAIMLSQTYARLALSTGRILPKPWVKLLSPASQKGIAIARRILKKILLD